MNFFAKTPYLKGAGYWWVLLSLLFMGSGPVNAGEMEDRRIEIGLSLFPRVLAVDLTFAQKRGADDVAILVFVYRFNKGRALSYAQSLMQKHAMISNVPIKAVALNVTEIGEQGRTPAAAYFLVERLTLDEITLVLEFGNQHGRIVFSPFKGDVERGATIGIMITSRVQPYLNMATIKLAGIQLNPLLVNLAKRYE